MNYIGMCGGEDVCVCEWVGLLVKDRENKQNYIK